MYSAYTEAVIKCDGKGHVRGCKCSIPCVSCINKAADECVESALQQAIDLRANIDVPDTVDRQTSYNAYMDGVFALAREIRKLKMKGKDD